MSDETVRVCPAEIEVIAGEKLRCSLQVGHQSKHKSNTDFGSVEWQDKAPPQPAQGGEKNAVPQDGKDVEPGMALPSATSIERICRPDDGIGEKTGANRGPISAGTAPAPASGGETPDDDMVICPNCVHQFRAIPVNVQEQLAQANAAREGAMEEAARICRDYAKKKNDWEASAITALELERAIRSAARKREGGGNG